MDLRHQHYHPKVSASSLKNGRVGQNLGLGVTRAPFNFLGCVIRRIKDLYLVFDIVCSLECPTELVCVDNGHSRFMNHGGFSTRPRGPKLKERWEVVSSVAHT